MAEDLAELFRCTLKPCRPVCLVKETGNRVPTSFLVFLYNRSLPALCVTAYSFSCSSSNEDWVGAFLIKHKC